MESKLSRSDAENYLALPGLGEHLSVADLSKLGALLPLIGPTGEIVLAAALGALFPGQPRTTALAYLRQLRSRLRQGASDAGIDLALHVGGGTRTAPEDRLCWFTGPSRALHRVSAFSDAGTALRDPRKEPIPLQARILRGEGESEDPRRLVRIFVSYAHENRRLKEKLVKLLRARLANARDFRFKIWDDPKILPGEGWEDEIRAEIEACDLGLLFFSFEFLASDFIRKKELPYFVSADAAIKPSKLALPVGLAHVDLDDKRYRLQGIESKQIFRSKDRSFEDCAEARDRSHFANQLSRQILDFVEKHLPPVTSREDSAPTPLTTSALLPCETDEDTGGRFEGRFHSWFYGIGSDPGRFVPTRAVKARLDKEIAGEKPTTSNEQVDALEFLLAWVTDPNEPPFCALLGEYGMGKTTTCEAFTRRLLEAQSTDPTVPTPIYLDLRYVGDLARQNPLLGEILRLVSARTHSTGRPGEEAPTAVEIMELVQTGKAVAIFDGLDEVLVHLTASQGQSFTRELWRILPPRQLPPRRNEKGDAKPPAEATPPHPSGKLMISCRTHYFRTLREERNHFLGQDREAISPSDYRALVLLPFTTEQIEEYFEKNLPGQDVEKLLDLIRSVHNLEELAERPYTLKLIAEHIPKLEQWKLEGRKVTGVTLYREMVASWLERDAGKHTLTMDHKLSLMERFAAELWTSGKRAWSAKSVEDWLLKFLEENPSVKMHYEGKDRELLKEDLRTATFLVRDGEDGFRLAHTSLQEFFLAAYLHRALRERRFEAWQIPRPSPETLDFLGQLIAEKDETEAMAAFRELRGEYRPKTSELMLAYALRARERGHPAPTLAGFRLDGALLKDWTISSPEGSPWLDFHGASFKSANLHGARLHRIDVSNADFRGANLTCAELIGGKGKGTRFAKSMLVGTVFRDMDLGGSDFEGARLHRTQWLRCGLAGVFRLNRGKGGLFAGCEPHRWNLQVEKVRAELAALAGHAGGVLSCTFSPNGAALASAGFDGSVRLWDARTGEHCRSLRGHVGWIWSCAFSPDGAALASAGSDGTVRFWDPLTGEFFRSLQGHEGLVLSCAFSPDGTAFASTGQDGIVRLWNARTGDLIRSILGHAGWVLSCAFSPDGVTLASAGDDGSVRLWDARTGELLHSLRGHAGWVWSCAFSPDGAALASAGSDGTVRLWEARTGEPLRSLKGHAGGARFCAFSPDGDTFASAGDDGTVRLWDAHTGDPIRSLTGHAGWVWSCAFSPDGAAFASAGDEGTVRLWDARTGDPLRSLRSQAGRAWSCTFSPDGATLASAGSDGTVRLWDARTGEPLRSPRGQGWVWFCAFSPNGVVLATAGQDGTIRLWDTRTGVLLRFSKGHAGRVLSCAFSLDGATLASAGADGIVQLWDARTGEPLRSLQGHAGWVLSCVFSPDGATLASAGQDGTVRLWDASSGKPIRALKGHARGVKSCAFSLDGVTLASAGDDGTLRLWDARTGDPLWSLKGHAGGVWFCSFSPDGTALASAGDDGSVRLWDAATGKSLRILNGHRGDVRSCVFSSDGSRLASGGDDGTVRVWNTVTGQGTGRIERLPGGESASFFGPDLALSYASPGAWRYLGWLAPDPETGVITRYPAEIFGPLPGPDEKGGFRER